MPVQSEIFRFAADLRRQCDTAYQDYQEGYAQQLEAVTNGATVRRESRALGVCTWDLLKHNPTYAKKHATDEAWEFMTTTPHMSGRRYEKYWLEAHGYHGDSETKKEG